MENNVLYQRIEDQKRIQFIQQSIQALDSNQALQVLDVGCGNGNIARFLGGLGYTVLGIDVSDQSIQKATKLNHLANVSFQTVAAEDLQLTNQFDVVICSEVIEHLHEPDKVVNELTRLLKPGGLLIVTVPNGFGPRELFITKPMQWFHHKTPRTFRWIKRLKMGMGYTGETVQSDAENLTHVQFFTKRSLLRLIEKSSMTLISFSASNFIEGVFPISLLSRKSTKFQAIDCWIADQLPVQMASGFMTAWRK